MKQPIVEKTFLDGSLHHVGTKSRTVYTDKVGKFIRNLHGKKYLFEENGKLTFATHVRSIRSVTPMEVMKRLGVPNENISG